MTSIAPRSSEVAAVLAAMEEDYPSGEAAAKEVIKVAYGALAARDWFLVLVGQGRHVTASYGPYATEAEAAKAGAMIGVGFDVRIHKITGAGILNANAKGNPDLPGYCKTKGCGHAAWEHLIGERNTRGKCARPECPCASGRSKFKK